MSISSLLCQRIWNKEIEFCHKLWFRYLWNPMNVDLGLFKLGFYVWSNNISLKYQGYIFGLESLRLNFFCPGLCQFKSLLFSFVYNTKAHICCRIGTRFSKMNNVDNNGITPQIKIDNAENSLFPKKMKCIMINNYYKGLQTL